MVMPSGATSLVSGNESVSHERPLATTTHTPGDMGLPLLLRELIIILNKSINLGEYFVVCFFELDIINCVGSVGYFGFLYGFSCVR